MRATRFCDDGVPAIYLDAEQLKAKRQIEDKVRTGHYGFESVQCALCEGTSFDELASKDRCGLETHAVICTGCGLLQSNPRMTQRAFAEYYATG